MNTVHVVLPAGTDDPARPSGGHRYNRRVCDGLAGGWVVHEHPVPAPWPAADPAADERLAEELRSLPAGAIVLIDGLIATPAAAVVLPELRRLTILVLVHMPLGGNGSDRLTESERAVLAAAAAVVTTSDWTRTRLLERYGLPMESVVVARPGVDPASPAPGTAAGAELLCVATVAAHKGHDVLLAALAALTDLDWHCRLVGPAGDDPPLLARLRRQAAGELRGRITFAGALTGSELDNAYARADLLVLASRTETYGMVITEALARALPVVCTAVGGMPEALGRTLDLRRPGLLVPPGNADALAAALRRWLVDAELRDRLRAAAHARREQLSGWDETVERVASVLARTASLHQPAGVR